MTNKPIRILCVTAHCDLPETETFIGLHKLKFQLHVLCSPNAKHIARLRDAGVPIVPFDFSSKLDRPGIDLIRKTIDEHAIEVLHLFNNQAVLNGLVAARRRKLKIIAYRGIVGNVSFLNPASWMRYLNPRVDRIVCVAEAIRQHLLNLRLLWLRIPEEKLVTIYKGHRLSWYDQEPANLQALGVSANDFVICCVANWRPRKGIEVLIEAIESLPQNIPARLVLVGDMSDEGLRRKILNSPASKRIIQLGPRDDAPAIVAAADVAVLPSTKREGLPKTVIEAMAYGIAPIVTNVGGSPELVQHERNGLVVPPRDPQALARAVTRLYRDETFRLALGAAAKVRIDENFRLDTTIAKTANLYRELVGRL